MLNLIQGAPLGNTADSRVIRQCHAKSKRQVDLQAKPTW